MRSQVVPSLICADPCNLERDISALENAGCNTLHVDIIDGYFSPSMPLGLDTVRALRQKTTMRFDAHVMARDNTFFIEELVDIGVYRLCFHVETEHHIAQKLGYLKANGIKAGLALAPATPIAQLEYIIESCDFVLLMMINPGFASQQGESIPSYMYQKIRDLKTMIDRKNLTTDITLDGRIYTDGIPQYYNMGARTFVGGTSSIFKGGNIGENYRNVADIIESLERKE